MALLRKKERLYSENKMEKWGLEVKISIKNNKEEAFSVMLPKETKKMLRLRETFGMYNFSIDEEWKAQTRSQRTTCASSLKISSKYRVLPLLSSRK
jgi:hypothetical protein